MKRGEKVVKVVLRIVSVTILVLLAVSTLLPYMMMVSASFMAQFEIYDFPPKLFPSHPKLDNYVEMWKSQPWGRYIFNTVFVAVTVVLGQLFVISTGGYALSRLHFPGRDTVFKIFIAFMMLPGVVTLIPGFIILHSLGWIDTYMALIVPSLGNIWGMFLMRQYMLSLPKSLEDAARIDGASEFTIFWRIILPLCKPVLATVATFTFLGTWRSFLWPLIVTRSKDMRMIEVGIAMFATQYTVDYPVQLAAATLSSIPLIIVYFFAQRWLLQGIKLSAGYER